MKYIKKVPAILLAILMVATISIPMLALAVPDKGLADEIVSDNIADCCIEDTINQKQSSCCAVVEENASSLNEDEFEIMSDGGGDGLCWGRCRRILPYDNMNCNIGACATWCRLPDQYHCPQWFG